MVTLITQLKEDITMFFKENVDYSDILIKEEFEKYPEISYPAIVISEIENEDNAMFFDETERVSNLCYQFSIYSEQSIDKTAVQNVREIASLLDTYLKGPKYRCLRRLGSLAITPLPDDDNVIVGYLRYDCSLEINTNTIYRRS
jgi:hypothetical protein